MWKCIPETTAVPMRVTTCNYVSVRTHLNWHHLGTLWDDGGSSESIAREAFHDEP